MSTKRREGCERTQADSHFTSVLDVRRARSDERVATTTCKLRISPQFWTSDDHEVTRGLRGDLKNSHFATVSDVRRARSDERVVSRLDRPNPPCVKKERNFKEVLIQQIFSAYLRSRSSQQIFSADLLSRSSQPFSADFLSRFSQQIFSADLLSRCSQQIFSADLLSRFSQQIFSADLLSRSSHLSYHLLWSGVGGQLLSYHSYHLPWSGVGGQLLSYRLLWSGVGGQLLSYHLLWSGVGGQLLSYHVGGQYCTSSLEGPFRGVFGKKVWTSQWSVILRTFYRQILSLLYSSFFF